MQELPKREPYERQFIKLMAKGMRIIIEERIVQEKNKKRDERPIKTDEDTSNLMCS